MNRAALRSQAKGSLELIEETVHLLRGAPLGTLTLYYAGALPFVLGLLYFWADMSWSPFASQHLAGAALGLAALFLWMKFWQAVFAGQLRALAAAAPLPPLDRRRLLRIFISQCALQPAGLILLPLASIPILPLAWTCAFYQNLTALADDETPGLRALVRKAMRQATLWPAQNHVLLLLLSAFGLAVFLNWATVCFLLPGLVKTLFGFESIFTRSGASLLNSTFFATMFGLTYLCVDPIAKAAYVLRCFYGDSIQSGEDLKAELRQLAGAPIQLGVRLIVMAVLAGACQQGTVQAKELAFGAGSDVGEPRRVAMFIEDARPLLGWAAVDAETKAHAPATPASKSDESSSPATLSPPALDNAIQQVIQQRKYTWRLRRETTVADSSSGQGSIRRFIEQAWKWVTDEISAFGKWVGEWLRKIFWRNRQIQPGGSGYGWMGLLYLLLYLLLAAVVVGLALLLFHILRERQSKAPPLATEPLEPAPDLTDESLAADQLPEDGWLTLARELLERGELRLALRAFYFSSLAHLARRNLISLAKFKSNRDYQRELQRRGHAFADLLALFAQNVSVFDSRWYGLHHIDRDLVSQFAANVERIRGPAAENQQA
jgi:hypothetical protein